MPQAVRANRLPGRFAEGGLVPRDGADASQSHFLRANLDVSPDLIVRTLETSPGVRALLRVVSDNQKSFNGALGR
jgi:hypothetical protein